MNRSIEYNNHICYRREVSQRQKIHRNRVKDMRSTCKSPIVSKRHGFDNTEPNNYNPQRKNIKKIQMDREKMTQIAKENDKLVERMQLIMDSPGSSTPVGVLRKAKARHSMEFIPGTRLGSNQNPVVDCYLSNPSQSSRGCAVMKHSLNLEYRKREQIRIAQSNAKLYGRLENQRPYYDVSKWEDDRVKMKEMMKYMRHDRTVGHLTQSQDRRRPKSQQTSTYRSTATSLYLDETQADHAHSLDHKASPHHSRNTKNMKQLPPYHAVALFEATSNFGVEFTLSEMQTKTSVANSGKVAKGFMGLKIEAKNESRQGEFYCDFETLFHQGVLLQSQDPEISIQLGKINTHAQLGLCPRLTEIMTKPQLVTFLLHVTQIMEAEVNPKNKTQFILSLDPSALPPPTKARRQVPVPELMPKLKVSMVPTPVLEDTTAQAPTAGRDRAASKIQTVLRSKWTQAVSKKIVPISRIKEKVKQKSQIQRLERLMQEQEQLQEENQLRRENQEQRALHFQIQYYMACRIQHMFIHFLQRKKARGVPKLAESIF